jgi:energy-coupling factor transport system permease protein
MTERDFFAHRLDPRSLVAYVAAITVCAFAIDHPAVLVALAGSVWIVVVSVMTPAEYRAYLLYGVLSGLMALVLNPLVGGSSGATVLFTGISLPLLGTLVVSVESLAYGAAMMLRLLAVIGAFALYATVVDGDALFRMTAPASPAAAVVIALSMRLFPLISRDAQRMAEARRCRGARLGTGSIRKRIASSAPILISLVTSSLERATDLAEALESRGFGRPGRTRAAAGTFERADVLVLTSVVLCAAIGVLAAVRTARFSYYPVLEDPTAPQALASAGVIMLFTLAPLALAGGWSRWRWLRSRI